MSADDRIATLERHVACLTRVLDGFATAVKRETGMVEARTAVELLAVLKAEQQ